MRAMIFLLLLLVLSTGCRAQTTMARIDTSGKAHPVVASSVRVKIPADADSLGSFRCSMRDVDFNLWFGTTGAGIYKWNRTEFTHYGAENGLGNQYVNFIMQDADKTMWAATDSGVYTLRNDTFRREVFPGIGAKKFTVYSIAQVRNDMWFATEQYGLWKKNGVITLNFDPHIEIEPEVDFENYKVSGGYWFIVPRDSMGVREVHESAIQLLYVRNNGSLWISTMRHGLFSFLNEQFTPRGNYHAFSMLETGSENFWIGTRNGGICRFDSAGIWSCFNQLGTAAGGVMCMIEDSNERMWIASIGSYAEPAGSGIVSYRTIQDYTHKKDPVFWKLNIANLRNNRVWTLLEDAAGNIWIGTSEYGLYCYDRKGSFIDYSPSK